MSGQRFIKYQTAKECDKGNVTIIPKSPGGSVSTLHRRRHINVNPYTTPIKAQVRHYEQTSARGLSIATVRYGILEFMDELNEWNPVRIIQIFLGIFRQLKLDKINLFNFKDKFFEYFKFKTKIYNFIG